MSKRKKILLAGGVALAVVGVMLWRRRSVGGNASASAASGARPSTVIGALGVPGPTVPAATAEAEPVQPAKFAGYLVSDLDAASEEPREAWWQKFLIKHGTAPTAKQEAKWQKGWLKGYARTHAPDL